MFRRTLVIAVVLALLAPAGAMAQQTQSPQNQQAPQQGPFGPLPPSAPEPTATPEPVDNSSDSSYSFTDRNTLYLIAAALLVAFIGIGVYISRDARRSLPSGHRPDSRRLREEGPHRHRRQAKARARARGRAQKAARRRNR